MTATQAETALPPHFQVGYNKIVLCGLAERDAKLFYNDSVAVFPIKVENTKKGHLDLFLDIKVVNKSMLSEAGSIKKGDRIYVEGRILPKQHVRETRRYVKMTLIATCLVKVVSAENPKPSA